MNQRWMTLAAVAGLMMAGSAKADPGSYAPPGGPQAGMYGQPPSTGEFSDPNTFVGYASAKSHKAPDRYGLLPGLRNLFHFKSKSKSGSCNDGNCGKAGCNPGYAAGPGAGMAEYPPVMQGTLVFPHHPFVRSPRDFFMYEPGR